MTEPRIHPIAVEAAEPQARERLAQVRKAMGMLPALYRVVAHSPAALAGYDEFARALEAGALPKRVREQIALMVAATNSCDYCLAAHRVSGRIARLSQAEIDAAESGTAADPKEAAALSLASELLAHAGDSSDATLGRAREAGWRDTDIVEIGAHVAINVFTNMINRLARTPIDFGRAARVAAEIMARLGKA
jgi:uncharacterized peroxidase-related enzyme